MAKLTQAQWDKMTKAERLQHLLSGKTEIKSMLGADPRAKVGAADSVKKYYWVEFNGVVMSSRLPDIVSVLREAADGLEVLAS